jgi:hypothetical protein
MSPYPSDFDLWAIGTHQANQPKRANRWTERRETASDCRKLAAESLAEAEASSAGPVRDKFERSEAAWTSRARDMDVIESRAPSDAAGHKERDV